MAISENKWIFRHMSIVILANNFKLLSYHCHLREIVFMGTVANETKQNGQIKRGPCRRTWHWFTCGFKAKRHAALKR